MCLGISLLSGAAPITTGSLIDEMVNMQRLTHFPSPAYRTVQFSSYDHRSVVPGGEHWFANSDGFGKEPVPNFEAVLKAPEGKNPGEYLMCDVAGPGAIVRLWTAQITGNIRVHLDEDTSPVYDGPAEAFLLRPYDGYLGGSGLTPEDLKGSLYQRNASYAPIPFAKRCRIVWIGNHRETHFYQIQIRLYDKEAQVTTFSPGDLKNDADRIRKVASILTDVDSRWPYHSTKSPVEISVKVAPHSKATGLELRDPGALERLTLRADAPRIDEALRQTLMCIQCDGDPWGQVQSPIGDFFGAGPGINPYTSVPFTVAPDGVMTCRFIMPYKESIRILFDNRGEQEVTVTGSALPAEYAWDGDSSMHFRARWRVDHGLVASGSDSMGVQDMPFLIARGQGTYVGTALMLLNPNTVPTSWGNWWGEGDEKVFVDNDVRPSIFGTGSEDYFNYAWSASDIFAFPYCGQPRNDGPANRGFVVNYRWHIVDPVPFAHNIAFYMELFSHERTEGFSYGRISYHYARPGTVDDQIPLTDAQTRLPELPSAWEPAPRFGALKWEVHACEDLLADKTSAAYERGGLWQGGQVLVWIPTKAGESRKLSVTIAEKGDYEIFLACMFRGDGGAFRAQLDGKPILFDGRESVSLEVPSHILSRVIGAKAGQLKPGEHDLVLTAEAAGRPIGLDFLAVRKR
jgi:hypothetical protein